MSSTFLLNTRVRGKEKHLLRQRELLYSNQPGYYKHLTLLRGERKSIVANEILYKWFPPTHTHIMFQVTGAYDTDFFPGDHTNPII